MLQRQKAETKHSLSFMSEASPRLGHPETCLVKGYVYIESLY
ncbi:MAG: hypothetical protein QOJ51_2376 [Acidobacteriaceae bacterium]|nr:hypothetical protein [Acidobacteriaceae bacterium]MEA2259551.1 hypothetical protein [Acidobacteriaceae bacterium]